MNTITKLIVATAVAALFANAVQAQTVETTSVTVRYTDVDLNTQAGQNTLIHRIRSAATQACGGQSDARDLTGKQAFKKCFQAATDKAMVAINAKRNPAVAVNTDQ